jgi:uncharacterized protein YqeY
MSLADTLSQDMKASMKAKENATLSTLRLLLAAMKNKQIDLMHALSDAEIRDVMKTQVKQLKDSIVSFEAGARADMVASAQAEIVVLEKYLPAQISDEALHAIVVAAIAETGATSKADMGKVMGAAVKAAAGGADGGRVKHLVMQLLPVVVMVVIASLTASRSVFAAIPLSMDDFGLDASFFELGLRLFRVLILWLGVPGITLLLAGGFQYMVASARDAEHVEAWGKIMTGFFGTVVVAGVFAITTVALQRL